MLDLVGCECYACNACSHRVSGIDVCLFAFLVHHSVASLSCLDVLLHCCGSDAVTEI